MSDYPAGGVKDEWYEEIRRTHFRLGSVVKTAAAMGTSRATVWRALRALPAGPTLAAAGPHPPDLPEPDPVANGVDLPDPCPTPFEPFVAGPGGAWGILSDVHIPFHDLRTIRVWADECKRMGVVGLMLNGDVLDFYQLSTHLRDPSKPRMREEVEKGRQFFEYLRAQFPRARILYKFGNHDERLFRYLAARAADIFDLDDLHLSSLLRLENYGVEWVEDKRVVVLGKLPVIHGHEYPGGGGIMPARWLFLRTGGSVLSGHFHQPSFYPFRTITGKNVGAWSVGCGCHLSPQYRPLNQWSNGYAMVEVAGDGGFHVHNRMVLRDGKVV